MDDLRDVIAGEHRVSDETVGHLAGPRGSTGFTPAAQIVSRSRIGGGVSDVELRHSR
jgi:hypothetical protein